MKIFYLFLTLILLFSCTRLNPEEKLIKEPLGKTVQIGMFESVRQKDREIPFGEFRKRYPFISLVYLENGCSPCYPKFIEWQTRMDTLDLHEDFTILFVILGSSYERFMDNLYEYEPEYEPACDQYHVVMDPDHRFLDNNPDIERWIIDKSLLIGPENKIKLIGPPFASQRMKEMFYDVVGQ